MVRPGRVQREAKEKKRTVGGCIGGLLPQMQGKCPIAQVIKREAPPPPPREHGDNAQTHVLPPLGGGGGANHGNNFLAKPQNRCVPPEIPTDRLTEPLGTPHPPPPGMC